MSRGLGDVYKRQIVNRDSINFSSVHIQGYKLNSLRTLYVLEEISIAPNEVITRNFGADFDAYEFVFTTDGFAEISTEVSVWGRNESGAIIDVQRVVAEEQSET